MSKFTYEINAAYGEGTAEIDLKDQYYNMREKIEPVKGIVDIAYQAMENVQINPEIKPVRGGTDGSQLSYKGLPTPNIFTGGENYHGKYEYISATIWKKQQMSSLKFAGCLKQRQRIKVQQQIVY